MNLFFQNVISLLADLVPIVDKNFDKKLFRFSKKYMNMIINEIIAFTKLCNYAKTERKIR